MYRAGIFDEVGLFSSLKKAVTSAANAVVNTAINVATTVTTAVLTVVGPAIKAVSEIGIAICPELAAKIGAFILNMDKDEQGNYHAKGDCWQQYFGYLDLYDIVFNLTTSMKAGKFPFDVNGDKVDDYILWAWKGDYMNLGAGAELGIYKRWSQNNNIWIVDRSLAMTMTLELKHKGTTIIDWRPTAKQWWITGFNPKKENLNANAANLQATYTVTFTNSSMYNAFKSRSTVDKYGWDFGVSMKPSFTF